MSVRIHNNEPFGALSSISFKDSDGNDMRFNSPMNNVSVDEKNISNIYEDGHIDKISNFEFKINIKIGYFLQITKAMSALNMPHIYIYIKEINI